MLIASAYFLQYDNVLEKKCCTVILKVLKSHAQICRGRGVSLTMRSTLSISNSIQNCKNTLQALKKSAVHGQPLRCLAIQGK